MLKLIISCDGSSAPTKNKRRPVKSAIGYYIEANSYGDNIQLSHLTFVPTKIITHGQSVKCKTSNEAEFMAILEALRHAYKTYIQVQKQVILNITIVSDSKLAITCISREHKLSAPNLLRIRNRIDKIINGLHKLGISIKFVWKRRNSTEGLRMANSLAQSANRVKVH